ncbi:hypothetical protein ACWGB8_08490 [Kitasatospora sp. NPDC054939]
MTGTVITDLRRRGAVDPGRVLTGPLRGVGLQRLEAGSSTEVTADEVEHALYVTAGTGTADAPDMLVPLVEGTGLTLPLGTRTVLTAGPDGIEYFHAVLTVPGSTPRTEQEGGEPE